MLRPRRPSWLTEDQDGVGVFVPGLMGAGLLVSIAMLLADGFRRLDPFRSEDARERATQAYAEGRVRDLHAVAAGAAPALPRFAREPRGRVISLVGGVVALGLAAAAIWWSLTVYHGTGSVLSDRGWTLGGGAFIALLLATPGLLLLLNGALGPASPAWLQRVASRPPLGHPVGLIHSTGADDRAGRTKG